MVQSAREKEEIGAKSEEVEERRWKGRRNKNIQAPCKNEKI